MVGADLNTLVNCDIVDNVSPPPDPALFPEGLDTGWVKPGRAVWRFLDGGENSLEGMKEFSRLAGELGFEYNVIEGFWQRWTDAQLRELVDDSKAHGVGIWLWKHSKDLRTPEARAAFFREVQGCRRGRGQDRFLRPRGQGGRRPLPAAAPRGGPSPAHGRLPRRQQAHRRVAHLAERAGARGGLRPGAQGHDGVGAAQHDAPLHPLPRRPGRLHAGPLRRPPPRDVVGAPDRHRGGHDVALARLRRPPPGASWRTPPSR